MLPVTVFVVIFFALAALLLRKALAPTPCKYGAPGSMHGRIAVVTGSTAGIGMATALRFASLGATVVLANRSREKSLAVAAEAQSRRLEGSCAFVAPLDLADLRTVESFASAFLSRFSTCDVLVLNAGVLARKEPLTVQGYEQHWGVNYLAHFHLAQLLLPAVARVRGRVITVSSLAMWSATGIDFAATRFGSKISDWRAYAQSKLALSLFTKELARRHPETVSSFSVDPGVVRTQITTSRFPDWVTWLWNILPIASTAEQGAQTIWFCALAPLDELAQGATFRNCRAVRVCKAAEDPELAKTLWEKSLEAVAEGR